MATTESNKPLIGGLTFLGATVIQISVALISQAVTSGNGVSKWVDAHPAWAVVMLLLVSTLLTSATLWLTSRHSAEAPEAEALDDAARELVASLRSQLDEESQLRLLDSPRPIPIRWHNADDSLIDHWRNIRLDPMSDLPIGLDGEGDEILDVFRRVPSGRLVVLGRAGAGKSVLMMRFMRSVLADGDSGARVPVLLALSTWDPASTPFNVWLARELATEYPSLGQRTQSGASLARRLIERGRLIYVLDGLDEMSGGLRAEALRAISTSVRGTDAILLTCRLAEYRTAVAVGGALAGAAAVAIEDLHPSDVVGYLSSTTGDARRGSRWTDVLANIDTAAPGTPAAALREALRTPLMVQVARTVYQNPKSRPEDLLSLGDTKSIENVLLDQYLAVALDPGPGMRPQHERSFHRTERYLSQIAKYMVDAKTPYFRWWDLHKSLSRKARILLGIFVGFVAMLTLVAGYLALAFISLMTAPNSESLPGDAETSTAASTASAVLFMFVVFLFILAPCIAIAFFVARYVQKRGSSDPVSPLVPVRLRRNWRRKGEALLRRRTGRQTFIAALRIGVVAGIVNGLGAAVQTLLLTIEDYLEGAPASWSDLPFSLLYPISFAVGSMLAFTLALWAAFEVSQLIEEPVILTEVWSPIALLRSDRRTALSEALLSLLAAMILGAAIALPTGLLLQVSGGFVISSGENPSRWDLFFTPVIFILPGTLLLTLIMILLLTSWGRFTLARVYFGCTHKFPFRLLRFLSSMRRKGILRQTGPAFQFRHLRLRDRLAIHNPGPQG